MRHHMCVSSNSCPGSSLLVLCSVLGSCLLSEGQTLPTGAFQLPPAQPIQSGQGAQMQQPIIGAAAISPDPHAPAALNCFAAGEGIREGAVGKVATFEVVSRDMFGDEHRCDPERFVVRVLPLTASHDEEQTQCHSVQGSQGCLTCRSTTVCLTGTEAGACHYAYTPETAGNFRVQVLTPSATGEGLYDIQGSPFRAHVEDGGYFLPGVSVVGYLGLFLVGMSGALVLVTVFFAFAWKRWKKRQPPTEDDLEIARLEQIAEELEETRQGRQEREQLLQRLRERRREAGGGMDEEDGDWGLPDSSGEEEEEEEEDSQAERAREGRGWMAQTVQGVQRGVAAWETLQSQAGVREGRGGRELEALMASGGESWKNLERRDSLDEWGGTGFAPARAAVAFEIGTMDDDDDDE